MISKIGKAWRILRHDGLKALSRTVVGYLRRNDPPRVPDECKLVFRALNATASPGIMVDVGAHFGTALLPFARAGWHVIALEPDGRNRGRLVEETREFSKVVVDPRAASDHDESGVSFFSSAVSSGISGLQAFDASHERSESVTLAPLSRILDDHGAAQVDFLKIDTEGFDLFVLKGVPWETKPPRAIVCEFEDRKTKPLGYSYGEMAQYLLDRGYWVVVSEWKPIVRYGGDHDWLRFFEYPGALDQERSWGNLIAVRGPELKAKLQEAMAEFQRVRAA